MLLLLGHFRKSDFQVKQMSLAGFFLLLEVANERVFFEPKATLGGPTNICPPEDSNHSSLIRHLSARLLPRSKCHLSQHNMEKETKDKSKFLYCDKHFTKCLNVQLVQPLQIEQRTFTLHMRCKCHVCKNTHKTCFTKQHNRKHPPSVQLSIDFMTKIKLFSIRCLKAGTMNWKRLENQHSSCDTNMLACLKGTWLL